MCPIQMSTPHQRLTEDELKQQNETLKEIFHKYNGREPMTVTVMIGNHFYELRYTRSLIDPDIRCLGPVSDELTSDADVTSTYDNSK